MVKPIIIITLPPITERCSENLIHETNKQIRDIKKDYHILVLEGVSDVLDVKVFFEKDFTETTYEELKEFIQSQLDKG